MRHLALLAAATTAALLAACGTREAVPAPTLASPGAIEAHVRFLADDLLEGREAGTRGHELAARYAAAQFALLGLEPGGPDGSWYQKVPLLRGTRVLEGARFSVARGGRVERFAVLGEFLPSVNYDLRDAEVSAPLVFVGQAVRAPELGHDDLAGVDLKGKIAVYFGGAPERFGYVERAVSSSSREKAKALVAAGAVGTIYLSRPEDEAKYPWERAAARWARPGMRVQGPDGKAVDNFGELRASVSLSVAAARRLFEGAPLSYDEALAQVAAGTARPMPLPGVATLGVHSDREAVESRNVVARLPGADPALAAEHVVFTAHLDHIGVNAPDPARPDADRINNGATDNALGTAILFEVARLMQRSTVRPRRSALFVLVTAEEKGLLGADYFAEFPTVPVGDLVADINMDMPVLLAPLTDVISFGAEHSTLGKVVAEAVRANGMTLSPDPLPEESVFVRSDQFAFVRRGIPSVYLDAGIVARDPAVDGKALLEGFLKEHYHQPSDEASLPIDYATAARLADVNLRIGMAVANDPQRPRWDAGSFLGKRYGTR
jgi:Zn-dependent M28 family amino/carboxypeptidase